MLRRFVSLLVCIVFGVGSVPCQSGIFDASRSGVCASTLAPFMQSRSVAPTVVDGLGRHEEVGVEFSRREGMFLVSFVSAGNVVRDFKFPVEMFALVGFDRFEQRLRDFCRLVPSGQFENISEGDFLKILLTGILGPKGETFIVRSLGFGVDGQPVLTVFNKLTGKGFARIADVSGSATWIEVGLAQMGQIGRRPEITFSNHDGFTLMRVGSQFELKLPLLSSTHQFIARQRLYQAGELGTLLRAFDFFVRLEGVASQPREFNDAVASVIKESSFFSDILNPGVDRQVLLAHKKQMFENGFSSLLGNGFAPAGAYSDELAAEFFKKITEDPKFSTTSRFNRVLQRFAFVVGLALAVLNFSGCPSPIDRPGVEDVMVKSTYRSFYSYDWTGHWDGTDHYGYLLVPGGAQTAVPNPDFKFYVYANELPTQDVEFTLTEMALIDPEIDDGRRIMHTVVVPASSFGVPEFIFEEDGVPLYRALVDLSSMPDVYQVIFTPETGLDGFAHNRDFTVLPEINNEEEQATAVSDTTSGKGSEEELAYLEQPQVVKAQTPLVLLPAMFIASAPGFGALAALKGLVVRLLLGSGALSLLLKAKIISVEQYEKMVFKSVLPVEGKTTFVRVGFFESTVAEVGEDIFQAA